MCDGPQLMYHGLVEVVNNVAYYKCNEGYTINNNLYSNGRKCTKSSKWEGHKEPSCRRNQEIFFS